MTVKDCVEAFIINYSLAAWERIMMACAWSEKPMNGLEHFTAPTRNWRVKHFNMLIIIFQWQSFSTIHLNLIMFFSVLIWKNFIWHQKQSD